MSNNPPNTKKSNAGRKLLYNDADELQAKVDEYFEQCDEGVERQVVIEKKGKPFNVINVTEPTPYTIEDLALHLGMTAQTMWNYGKSEKFFEIISRAKSKIHSSWVKGGLTNKYNARMAALCLAANNPDYRPQQDVNITTESIEDKLRRIGQQVRQQQITGPQADDVQDAEIVSHNNGDNDND